MPPSRADFVVWDPYGSQTTKSAAGWGGGAAEEAVGDEEDQGGEGEFEGSGGDRVGDGDAEEDAERGEDADHERVAQADVAVAVLAVGTDQGDYDDHQQGG